MKAFSLFNQVVTGLEQHENSSRIKKLIYSVCKKHWENDLAIIDQIGSFNLLQELRIANPTIDDFKSKLYNVVKTLNKQAEYSLVANVIVSEMIKIYFEDSETTELLPSPEVRISDAKPSPSKTPSIIPQKNNFDLVCDPFELRLEVMKYTNPLRVKILLFSLLKHKFDRSDQDWLLVKSCELDDLLKNTFHACATIIDLELKLHKIAKTLPEPNEYTQAANAIIQAMKPLYTAQVTATNQSESTQLLDNSHQEIAPTQTFISDDENTCQFFPG